MLFGKPQIVTPPARPPESREAKLTIAKPARHRKQRVRSVNSHLRCILGFHLKNIKAQREPSRLPVHRAGRVYEAQSRLSSSSGRSEPSLALCFKSRSTKRRAPRLGSSTAVPCHHCSTFVTAARCRRQLGRMSFVLAERMGVSVDRSLFLLRKRGLAREICFLKGCCRAGWDQLVLLEERWMRSMEGMRATENAARWESRMLAFGSPWLKSVVHQSPPTCPPVHPCPCAATRGHRAVPSPRGPHRGKGIDLYASPRQSEKRRHTHARDSCY